MQEETATTTTTGRLRDLTPFERFAIAVVIVVMAGIVYNMAVGRSAASKASDAATAAQEAADSAKHTANLADRVAGPNARARSQEAFQIFMARLISSDCRTRYLIQLEVGDIGTYVEKCLTEELALTPRLPTTTTTAKP